MRQVTPKPTSSRFVKAKARMALVTFWICRSRFFFFSPLWRQSTRWSRELPEGGRALPGSQASGVTACRRRNTQRPPKQRACRGQTTARDTPAVPSGLSAGVERSGEVATRSGPSARRTASMTTTGEASGCARRVRTWRSLASPRAPTSPKSCRALTISQIRSHTREGADFPFGGRTG